MFKTITGSSRYMTVNGNAQTTYVSGSGSSMGVGNLRYNTSNQCFEVYDGYHWNLLNMGHAAIGLTPEAEQLLDWAKLKKHEEDNLKTLAQTNPSIANLIKQRQEIDDQIKMVQILTK